MHILGMFLLYDGKVNTSNFWVIYRKSGIKCKGEMSCDDFWKISQFIAYPYLIIPLFERFIFVRCDTHFAIDQL